MSKSEHILDVAEDLFNQSGYTAVGVDLIRDQAGVSKTSMYRHFGSKNKLIEAVLIRRHGRFEEGLTSVVQARNTAESKLDALLSWHFAWFREVSFKGCMFMHALAEFKDSDGTISQHAIDHKVWLKSLICSVFDESTPGIAAKTEAVMTFLEGMIVRAEFCDTSGDEMLYRQAVKALIFPLSGTGSARDMAS